MSDRRSLSAEPGDRRSPDAAYADLDTGALVDRALARVRERPLRADRAPVSEILHGVLALGDGASVIGRDGRAYRGLEYLRTGSAAEGQALFERRLGCLRPAAGAGGGSIETHADQYLMVLGEHGVGRDRALGAVERNLPTTARVEDLLAGALQAFRLEQELGWTLAALSSYLESGRVWENDEGDRFSLERLLVRAVERDPRLEACGGSHHLYGVAYALARHRRAPSKPESSAPEGPGGAGGNAWSRAEAYLENFVAQTRALQQSNGEFSAAGFRGSAVSDTPAELVYATGHALEWLVLAVPPEDLGATWMVRPVRLLAAAILETSPADHQPQGLYHAAHALGRYRDRVSIGRVPAAGGRETADGAPSEVTG